MLAFTDSDEKKSPTIIGAGCKLKGNIETDHTVQIHGNVHGNIIAETLIIGRGGTVVGNIQARTLFLHGTLEGDATTETLNITGNNGLECKLAKRKDKEK